MFDLNVPTSWRYGLPRPTVGAAPLYHPLMQETFEIDPVQTGNRIVDRSIVASGQPSQPLVRPPFDAGVVHIALTLSVTHAVGALAVINSTRSHATIPGALRFYLVAPIGEVPELQQVVATVFPKLAGSSIFVVGDR